MPEPNPRRMAAGRRNRQLRGPLSPEARCKLRELALSRRPWEHSTGPKSPAGKKQAALNGKIRQTGPTSFREARREAAEIRALIRWAQEIGQSALP
jgi:hypothetical protein